MKVRSGSNQLSVLWDSGASISLITFKAATRLKLSGKEVDLSVYKIGGEIENIQSYKYVLPLTDKNGRTVSINVFGIEKITKDVLPLDNDKIYKAFPECQNTDDMFAGGEIDVLIGFDYALLHPSKKNAAGNLLLMSNKFGQCVAGSCRSQTDKDELQINFAMVNYIQQNNDFLTIESMGVRCYPMCGSCKCGNCSIGMKNCTIKEENEQCLIEEGLVFKGKYWEAGYPWILKPIGLPDNSFIIRKMLYNTEIRIMKIPEYARMYNEQIQDMLDRDVARKLTQKELEEYDGPFYYLSHHEVLKTDTTTNFRIVFNSSLKYLGLSLNDYWAKGPNLLNNVIGILLRFREELVAAKGDVKKMYHKVKLRLMEQHVHRFYWRNCQIQREPNTYVMTSVSFGDKPAANIAITALNKTAEMSQSEFPEAVKVIKNNTYMDDVIDSFKDLQTAKTITTQIDEVIGKGDFQIKEWFYSAPYTQLQGRESTVTFAEHPTTSVLGLVWDRSQDVLRYTIKLNFSKKKNGIFSQPNVKRSEVLRSIPDKLTKRIVLSIVQSIYDPLGFITPFTITAKLIIKNLWKQGLGWDDEIVGQQRSEIDEFLVSMFKLEDIFFKRCMKPQNAIGNPTLVTFSDASNDAFGACSYLHWELEGEQFESTLVAAKSRVSPLKTLSIVRLELCAAVLGARLANLVKDECRYKILRTLFIVDSQIVKSMVNKDSYGFGTFAAVRVGEIQNCTDVNDWYWIEGRNNIADWTTRKKNPEEIGEYSIWQKGPDFMKGGIESWCLKSTVMQEKLPEEKKKVTVALVQEQHSLVNINVININRFSKYRLLMQVTARILQIIKYVEKPSLKSIAQYPSVETLKLAERHWVKNAQQIISHKVEGGDYARLCPVKDDDGIYKVYGRAEKWLKDTYNPEGLILLPPTHRMSYLYALRVHNRDHLAVTATVCKIRNKFWIPQVQKIVTNIRNKCVTCKKLNKQKQEQIMGSLPECRTKPAPPFHVTFLDLFGPFTIRGVVNKRSRSKCFGVIFTCGVARAVHCDIVQDYSTDSFLQAVRRFTSLRGYPSEIYSDSGSQLVKANKEIEHRKVIQHGVEKGLTWHFSTPNAPWKNGCAEALIKSVKKSITIAIGDHILSFPELQTVVFEAANIVNERPIAVNSRDLDDGSYLCPNDLLLGRASSSVPSGSFKDCNPRKRFEFVQSLTDCFWKKWNRDFFTQLVIRPKWHTKNRNMCIGDIVLIQELNALRSQWKLGKVSKVYMSNDRVIRNVDIQYKNESKKKLTTVKRAVQSLVVLLPVEEDVDT